MTSYIICAFVSGFLMATVIFWQINRRQQKDWQAEYRRLMGGIGDAIVLCRTAPSSNKALFNIKMILNRTYNGDL